MTRPSENKILVGDPNNGLIQRLAQSADEHLGNARIVRNLVEHILQEQANRLAAISEPSREELMLIEEKDIIAAGDDLHSPGKIA